jgi:hypothetical protein
MATGTSGIGLLLGDVLSEPMSVSWPLSIEKDLLRCWLELDGPACMSGSSSISIASDCDAPPVCSDLILPLVASAKLGRL